MHSSCSRPSQASHALFHCSTHVHRFVMPFFSFVPVGFRRHVLGPLVHVVSSARSTLRVRFFARVSLRCISTRPSIVRRYVRHALYVLWFGCGGFHGRRFDPILVVDPLGLSNWGGWGVGAAPPSGRRPVDRWMDPIRSHPKGGGGREDHQAGSDRIGSPRGDANGTAGPGLACHA